MTTTPSRHFADLWWQKWIDVGTIETGSRGASSMGSLASHIRAGQNGWIDSWDQSSQLANYWRRYFQIPEIPGRHRFHHCQCGHYSTSCPDSPTGNVPLEHPQQWQGCQHGHTRTFWGQWWWPFPTTGSDLLGGRFGSPCQSLGGIYKHIVGPSPSHGGIPRRGLVSLRINSADDSSLYFEAISASGNE